MKPENDQESLLIGTIDAKGQAILDGGEAWSERILRFGTDPQLTDRERQLIDERWRYWGERISKANGVQES